MSLNLKDIHTGKLSIKNVSYTALVLNIASIVIGLFYIIFPISTPLWIPFGVVIVIAIFWNYLLVLVTDEQLNKADYHGNRINIICYSFLIYNIFAMTLMFGHRSRIVLVAVTPSITGIIRSINTTSG